MDDFTVRGGRETEEPPEDITGAAGFGEHPLDPEAYAEDDEPRSGRVRSTSSSGRRRSSRTSGSSYRLPSSAMRPWTTYCSTALPD